MFCAWTVIHAGALGDLALTIQLALRLPGVTPTGTLRIVSRTDPGDLSACRPRIERLSCESLELHWLYRDEGHPPPARLAGLLRGARVLSTLGGPGTITHRRLAALEPAAVYSIDPVPGQGTARHIVEQWQTRLEAQGLLVAKCIHQRPGQRCLGVPVQQLLPLSSSLNRQLTPAPAACPSGSGAMRDAILIHPGSGGRAKCWPLRCFVELARRLRERAVAPLCFVVGPAELERWPPAHLDRLAAEFPLLRSPTPDELVAVLAAARLFVGNDAGPAHLAALLGTATLTIFGTTSPGVWRPLGTSATWLWGDPYRFPDDWGIGPEAVAAAALSKLARGG